MPLLKHIVYIDWSVISHVFVYQYLTTGIMPWKGVVCTFPATNIATTRMYVELYVPHLFNSIYLICYEKRQIIPSRCSKTSDEYGKHGIQV